MGDMLLQLLGSAALAGVLAAIINAVVNRRKLSAEATEIITKASAGVVENLVRDNEALRGRLLGIETELATVKIGLALAERRERAHSMTEERYRWHLERWHRYAHRLAEEIKILGGEPEDAPSYWPDTVTADDVTL